MSTISMTTFASAVQLTNDILAEAPNADPLLMNDIRVKQENSPIQLAYRASIQAPHSEDAVKQIIGRDGCYFKMTTHQFKLFFVWHSRSTNHFHLWGNNIDNLNGAVEVINRRINIYAS